MILMYCADPANIWRQSAIPCEWGMVSILGRPNSLCGHKLYTNSENENDRKITTDAENMSDT